MKLLRSFFRSICSVLVLSVAVLSAGGGGAQEKLDQRAVKVIQHKKTIEIRIHGKLFSIYHFSDDFILPNTRPFFWPVLADDGTEVTIDHAQHPPLHAWQRSIWIGAGDVNGADQWTFKAEPIPRQTHLRFDAVDKDGFREELIWGDKADKPMLREVRTVRFLAYRDGSRGMNIYIAFTPVAGDVTFFDNRDHGILSVRPTPKVAEAPHFTSDNGSNQCDGRTSWCDESGSIDGKTYGIAIFDDPENPRHPPLWHAGPNARLATDIFLTHHGAPKHDPDHKAGDFTIAAGKTVSFRYGIVIHSGNATRARVSQKYKHFTSSKDGSRLCTSE